MSDAHSEYLSRLLGRDVDWRQSPKLTSGQKARYFAWCQANDLEFRLGRDGDEDPVSVPSSDYSLPSSATSDGGSSSAIYGVGVDIQQISELFPEPIASPKSDSSLAEIFSLRELSYAEGADDARQTLSGLFAAKEAIVKADPNGADGSLADIEVLPQSDGAPTHDGYLLSISHSGDFAVAFAAKLGTSSLTESSEIDETPESSTEPSKSKKNPVSKSQATRRSRLWVLRLAAFIGWIGGIWLLIDKLSGLT